MFFFTLSGFDCLQWVAVLSPNMGVFDETANDDGGFARESGVDKARALIAAEELPRFVRTEANLLRLPLFALDTKRLKTLDGIECKGRVKRDGQTHQFVFRATRNTATLYPGPLARSTHLAFLSFLTERGYPQENPLTWTWRDLCRRLGIVYGGKMVEHLKDAITATAGLLIRSEHALYSKPDGQPIRTFQDALHLYDRVVFVGGELPNGSQAGTNYLWLSEWYLKNLNALFTAPLDYELWRFLEERSPIASRLYEFLFLNFYSGMPLMRINYETLAQFLPVRPERFLSDAKRQMDSAFALLAETGVLAEACWEEGKNTLSQLRLYRGPVLQEATHPVLRDSGDLLDDMAETFKVQEIRNLKTPESHLVTQFYHLWTGTKTYRPTQKELAQATEVIAQHGKSKTIALLPRVVERLRIQWPDAKSFAAFVRYLPQVAADTDRVEQLQAREHEKMRIEREAELQKESARRQLDEKWRPIWGALNTDEQDDIRAAILVKSPLLSKTPTTLTRFCLAELARRRTGASPGEPVSKFDEQPAIAPS